jgi:uncharacterized membrane protein
LDWNLFLAWLPLVFAWLLVKHLKRNPWKSLEGVLYSLLWLGFLPNSFYIASDFVHMRFATSTTASFYIVLILSFTLNGFMLGFMSLYLVHKQLLRRFSNLTSHSTVGIILLLSSFAIYLGRYLRWNTWDVVVNPFGLIFDVSNRLVNPAAHSQTFRVTFLFSVLLISAYTVVWQFIQAIRQSKDESVKLDS